LATFACSLANASTAVAMLAGALPWVFGLAVVELLVGVWLDQRVAVPLCSISPVQPTSKPGWPLTVEQTKPNSTPTPSG